MNGGWGHCVRGVEATDVTVSEVPGSTWAIDVAETSLKTSTLAFASSTPLASKFLPVANEVPLTDSSVASNEFPFESMFAVKSNHVADLKSMRSRSLSQTRRIATDCTRPAERALSTARHSTGDTS